MGLIDRFFNKSKIQCPRCLGKGHVDRDDIRRLEKELEWIPDSCAYCNGNGKVDASFSSKVATDTTYLTTDLTYSERARFINNDKGAQERAKHSKARIQHLIAEIQYLHFVCGLDSIKITEFYLLRSDSSGIDEQARRETLGYINDVIKHKKEG